MQHEQLYLIVPLCVCLNELFFVSGGFFSLIGTMSTASAYQHPGRKKQRRGILRSTFKVEETKEKYVELRPFTFVTFNELMQMYIFL